MSQPSETPSVAPTPPSALAVRVSPVAGLLFALSLAICMASTLWLMYRGNLRYLPAELNREQALHGEVTHQFAKQLADAPLPSEAARLERAASWLLLGDLGPRVRQGCRDWLFLSDELRVQRNAAPNAQAKADAVIALQQALAARGIQLLVAVVPDKSRIAAQRLCGLQRPASLAPRIDDWRAYLQAQGVASLDLSDSLQPLGAEAFLRTDTHWSEAGAYAAARQIGEALQARGYRASPEQDLALVREPMANRPGDLVRLAGIDGLPLALQPLPEQVSATRVEPRADSQGDDLDDLFGDDQLPNTALIGTSFSRNSDFAGYLSLALGAPLGNFAKDGGEFSGAAKDYFASPAFTQTPPQLLIWEIPERDLQTAYDGAVHLP